MVENTYPPVVPLNFLRNLKLSMHARRLTITLDADFGSAFQCNFFMETLPKMLQAPKEQMESAHKKNKIIIHVTEWEDKEMAIRRERVRKLGTSSEIDFMKMLENTGVKFVDV